MGEVYRARDTRLGRDVAIKILSPRVAADPDALLRFEREARALATLNHPNIAAIYDVVETRGQPALILELVDGPTLADRLAAARSQRTTPSRPRSRSPMRSTLRMKRASCIAI